jgi:hypothetical protein
MVPISAAFTEISCDLPKSLQANAGMEQAMIIYSYHFILSFVIITWFNSTLK